MAHKLAINYKGVEWIDLASGNYKLVEYAPKFAGADVETVAEMARVEVSGVSTATLLAAVRKLEQAFNFARMNQECRNDEHLVELAFTPNAGTLGSAEILDGRVAAPNTILKSDWANFVTTVEVYWTRKNYWQGARTAVAFTGLYNNRVFVANDAAWVLAGTEQRKNVAAIAAAAVQGDLPTPVEIWLTNETLMNATDFLIGLNTGVAYTPQNEAELVTEGVITGASWGTYSGEYGRTFTLTSSLALIATFTLTSLTTPDVTKIYNRSFSLVGAWSAGMATDVELQARVFIGGADVYVGPINKMTADTVQVIDQVRIPGNKNVAPGTVQIKIYGRRTTTATTLTWDFLYFLPLNGYRVLSMMAGGAIGADQYIVDDGIDGDQWSVTTGFGVIPDFNVIGRGELLLQPNVDQQLMILPVPTPYDPDLYFTLEMFYRPRWSVL